MAITPDQVELVARRIAEIRYGDRIGTTGNHLAGQPRSW
jgi:hypothetical protein